MTKLKSAKFALMAKSPAGRSFRCQWIVSGTEISTIPAQADGTPKGGIGTTIGISLKMRIGDGPEQTLVDTGSIQVTLEMASPVTQSHSFNNEAMMFNFYTTAGNMKNLKSLTALWTSAKYGTFSFTLYKTYDGALGPRGYSGPVPIPCGVWKTDGIYTATAEQTDYAYDKTEGAFFYVNPPTSGTTTATVGTRPGLNATHWTRMNHASAIHAFLAVINGGTVGKAVFWEEFMYSQFGRKRVLDNQGNITGYDPVDATHGTYGAPVQTGNNGDTFEPNLLLNFLTGEAFMKNLTAYGTIYASTLYRSMRYIYWGSATSTSFSMSLMSLLATDPGNSVAGGSVTTSIGSGFQPADGLPDIITLVLRDGYTSNRQSRCYLGLPAAQDHVGKEIVIRTIAERTTSPSYCQIELSPSEGGFMNMLMSTAHQGSVILNDPSVTQQYGVKCSSAKLMAVAATQVVNGETTTCYGWMVQDTVNAVA